MDMIFSTLIPSLVESGNFGPGKFLSISSDETDIAFQFASTISKVNVNIILESGEIKSIPIVIKLQMKDFASREARDSGTMFLNELTMYTQVLPFLNKKGSRAYPKVYYGFASGGKDYTKDILILENVERTGYRISPIKLYFDFEHILIGLKKLAEMHAWSFCAKFENKETFLNNIVKLKECFVKKSGDFDFDVFLYEAMKRGMDPFIKKGIEADVLERLLGTVKPTMRFVKQLYSAEEPFGVVMHGDYCKNNMFFKYDSDNKPVDAMFFDLQHSKYGSPVTDLSFFLYLHTSVEMRERHWDYFLQIYWSMVRDSVPSEVPLPTFQEFLDHFASRAVYGYLPCSFFLPHMIGECQISIELFIETPFPQLIDILLNNGGEEGHQSVQNVVAHLLEKKYIHKYLEYYEKVKDEF